ncbi:MAG: patatin-like phospholipase family protein [Bacteroidota bacterium]
MYKNLVFKGGGVKGVAYAGAIQVLEQNGLLDGIEQVAGTSAGAITAALVSLRFSAAEIKTIVYNTDFKSFEDAWNPLRIATKYGLYKGDAFLQWMEKQLQTKGFAADATFADLDKAGCRGLRVFATDLNTHEVKCFSFGTTPNVVVAEAVRASMSIPLFFDAWKFKNDNPDNHIYVDGGVVYNYPITTFDTDGKINSETLGLFLSNVTGGPIHVNVDYGHIGKYVKNTFETLLNAQVIDFERDVQEQKRTVVIDDFGIPATDFELGDSDKDKLFNSGVKYTTAFLAKHLKSVPAS